MYKKAPLILILSTLLLPLAVKAGPVEDDSKSAKAVVQKPTSEPRFYLSLSAGGEFDIHATKFISNGSGDFGVPGAFSLPAKVQSRDFTAVHDPGVVDGELEGGYKINDFLTVFAGFTYSHADGDSHGAGRVTDPDGAFGPVGGIYNLNVKVSEYQAYTGRGGVKVKMPRYVLNLIHAPQAITPYFSASAGGKYLDETDARFTAGTFLDRKVGLYDASWVFTGQTTLGYEWAFTPNASLIFESGYGYDTKPDRSGSIAGFSGVNEGGSRFYSIVSLGGKIRF